MPCAEREYEHQDRAGAWPQAPPATMAESPAASRRPGEILRSGPCAVSPCGRISSPVIMCVVVMIVIVAMMVRLVWCGARAMLVDHPAV